MDCNVGFQSAAATLSLSANCLLTSTAVVWVPSLTLTSTLNLGGSDSSSRTRTPRPITVARLQWVIVGVTRTVTVRSVESGRVGIVGVIEISGKETTPNEPSVTGCSGSHIVEIRSKISCSSIGSTSDSASLSDSDVGSNAWKNGSLVWAGDGCEKIPTPLGWDVSVEVFRRRVGRSDGLMIVGFAFLPSSILVEWRMEVDTALSARAKIVDDNHCGTSNRKVTQVSNFNLQMLQNMFSDFR
jgi:hypothetical protein